MLAQQTFWNGVYDGVILAYEEVVPPPGRRVPLTLATVPLALLGPLSSFVFLAYLARRAETHLVRLLVLPAAIFNALHFTYQYKLEDRRLVVAELMRFTYGYYIIGHSLNFAFTRGGRFKLGEKQLKRIGDPDPTRAMGSGFLPLWLRDGLELACTMRGIGWDFGRDVYVPPRTTSTKRSQFLIDATQELLAHVLVLDFCDSLIKLVPGVGSPEGGSIFLPHLPPHLRYSVAFATNVLQGLTIHFSIEIWNDVASLVAVGLLDSAPESWHPLFGRPWCATSLHEFWGQSWHQVLRHMFLSFGGYSGRWLGGKAGLVLGTFLASGMYHALALQISDYRVVLFFTLQGVGVILENAYKCCTGRRVEGMAGWFWTMFWTVVLGQMYIDACAIGGLSAGIIIPEPLSVARRIVFPGVRSLVQYIGTQ